MTGRERLIAHYRRLAFHAAEDARTYLHFATWSGTRFDWPRIRESQARAADYALTARLLMGLDG